MFEVYYRREMDLVALPEEHLENIVTQMGREEAQPMKTAQNMIRTVLLAAALCAALAVTALAVSPGLREALGAFWPYRQTIEDMTAVDQGIEVKVVSALSDGNVIRLYFTARDLEGDRLDEYTATNFQIRPPQTDGQWKSGTLYLPRFVSYDKETKTALFTTGYVGDGLPLSDLTVSAGAQCFTPGRHDFRLEELPELGTPQVLECETLASGEMVLKPGQTPVELESEAISLSSYGFGVDGKLHILYQINVHVEKMYIRTFLSSHIWEEGDMTGNALSQRYNCELSKTTFQKDGTTYYDIAYDVDAADASDVFPEVVYGCIESGKTIEGTWRFDIPLENAPARVIDLRDSGTVLDGVTGERLSLTRLGVTVEGNPNGTSSQLAYKLTAFLKDGSRLHGTVDSNYYSGGHCSAHSSFEEPMDIDQVVGVALGMWYIPIDGDTAGQGYWLDAMP